MNKVFDVKCVCEDKVFNVLLQYEPMNGLIFMDGNGVEYQITNAKPIVTIGNPNTQQEVNYYLCVVRECQKNMVGVVQVKFIRDCSSYAEVEEKLNQFLYDNRHKYAILDITHAHAYVAIKYKLRSEKEKYASMAYENSLREREIVNAIKGKM